MPRPPEIIIAPGRILWEYYEGEGEGFIIDISHITLIFIKM